METNWATEHLQTIRTLMERSALYRRALAPITTFVGIIGILGAVLAHFLQIQTNRQFAFFWLGVDLIAVVGTLFLVRRQAITQNEPLLSSPTRRVAQAMFPALFAGLIASLFMGDNFAVATGWVIFYSLALHSAAFVLPQGVRIFAWTLLILGLGLGAFGQVANFSANLLMGLLFGASHFAYGIYLYFTERKNEA